MEMLSYENVKILTIYELKTGVAYARSAQYWAFKHSAIVGRWTQGTEPHTGEQTAVTDYWKRKSLSLVMVATGGLFLLQWLASQLCLQECLWLNLVSYEVKQKAVKMLYGDLVCFGRGKRRWLSVTECIIYMHEIAKE